MGALIVSPTRELAAQISGVLEEFLKDQDDEEESKRLRQMLIICGDGRSVQADLRKVRKDLQ